MYDLSPRYSNSPHTPPPSYDLTIKLPLGKSNLTAKISSQLGWCEGADVVMTSVSQGGGEWKKEAGNDGMSNQY